MIKLFEVYIKESWERYIFIIPISENDDVCQCLINREDSNTIEFDEMPIK